LGLEGAEELVQHQPGLKTGGCFMWRFAVLIATASVVVSCFPEEEVTGSANKCATDIYPSYNPKVLDQCMAVCIKCNRGVTTTCSTSCTLKGAR
jgi:hypothetical protein